MLHQSTLGGHAGQMRIKGVFYWRNMKAEIVNQVSECDICQRMKTENVLSPGLLQPLPIPEMPWQDIAMDFIEGLHKSGSMEVILVVVDRLTKYGHFVALKHPYTTQEIAETFLREIYKLHGLPRAIVTDKDAIFTSQFRQQLFKTMGTKLNMTTSYHPQSDGQTEKLNRCLEAYLRSMVFTNPRQWVKWLTLAEWWYNTNYHNSLKSTPFQALYGFPPVQVPLGSLPYSTNTEAGSLNSPKATDVTESKGEPESSSSSSSYEILY